MSIEELLKNALLKIRLQIQWVIEQDFHPLKIGMAIERIRNELDEVKGIIEDE